MSYSIYVERHKSLDSLCDSAMKRFENANSAWGKAFTDHKTADRNLSRADEETKPERARELNASAERLDGAAREVNDASEQRERVWADRAALEKDYPVFDAAQEKGISPSDPAAPPDEPTPGERSSKPAEQTIGVIKAGLQAGGVIAKLYTATPDIDEHATLTSSIEQIQQEVNRESISPREHQTEVYEAHVSATPEKPQSDIDREEKEKAREKEQSKEELDSLIKTIGGENKMTSAGGMKSKRDDRIADWDKANAIYDDAVRHAPARSADNVVMPPEESLTYSVKGGSESRAPASIPDPDKPVVFAVDLKSLPAIPDPEHRSTPTTEQTAAEKPVADKPVGSAPAMPNPDPPARALAAQAPANDNTPRSPANDNDPNL